MAADRPAVSPADQAAPIREALALLSSMVRSGESHSKRSEAAVAEALDAALKMSARCEQLERERDDNREGWKKTEWRLYDERKEHQRTEAAWVASRARVEQLERELAEAERDFEDMRRSSYHTEDRADRLAAALRDIAIEVVAARKTLDAYGTLDRISEIVGAALEDEAEPARVQATPKKGQVI